MTCMFCGTVGIWLCGSGQGRPDICPTCQESPARQGWYVELHALGAAMRLEAFGRGLSANYVALSPEIEIRWRTLGHCPA